MIIVIDRNGKMHRLYSVDAHHHIGKEEHTKNLQPNAPGGTYEFIRSLLFGSQWKAGVLKEILDQPDEFKFVPVNPENVEVPDDYINLLVSTASHFKGLDLTKMYMNTLLFDQIVVFPMNDIYKNKEVARYQLRGDKTPTFSHSNERVSRFSLKYPNSLRFIGFGRVCPQDDHALEEVERMVTELGLRGLKVHPKSDYFKLDSQDFKDVIHQCARFDIPVISHTTFLNDVLRIHDSVNDVLVRMYEEGGDSDDTVKLMRQTRFILGHCGWHNSRELYEVLSHPCIFGEISGVKGEVVSGVWETAKKQYTPEYFDGKVIDDLESRGVPREFIQKVFPRSHLDKLWSRKLMMGTDFPFLDQPQAIDVIKSLFSVRFPGNAYDLQNILGANALRVIRPYHASRHSTNTRIPLMGDLRTGGSGGDTFHRGFLKGLLAGLDETNIQAMFIDQVVDSYPTDHIRPYERVVSILMKNGRSVAFLFTQNFHDLSHLKPMTQGDTPPRFWGMVIPIDADTSRMIARGDHASYGREIAEFTRDLPQDGALPDGWLEADEMVDKVKDMLVS